MHREKVLHCHPVQNKETLQNVYMEKFEQPISIVSSMNETFTF